MGKTVKELQLEAQREAARKAQEETIDILIEHVDELRASLQRVDLQERAIQSIHVEVDGLKQAVRALESVIDHAETTIGEIERSLQQSREELIALKAKAEAGGTRFDLNIEVDGSKDKTEINGNVDQANINTGDGTQNNQRGSDK